MAGRGLAHASLNRSFLKTFKQLSISIKLVCQEYYIIQLKMIEITKCIFLIFWGLIV